MRLRRSCQAPHDGGTIHLLRSGDFHLSLAILLALRDLHSKRAASLVATRAYLGFRAAAVAITGHEALFEHPQEVREVAGWPCCRLIAQVTFQLSAQLGSCE